MVDSKDRSPFSKIQKNKNFKLNKIQGSAEQLRQLDELKESVGVIVKVIEDGYQPEGIHVRAKVSPTIFTANVSGADLARLEKDDLVKSVSISEKLGLFDEE